MLHLDVRRMANVIGLLIVAIAAGWALARAA